MLHHDEDELTELFTRRPFQRGSRAHDQIRDYLTCRCKNMARVNILGNSSSTFPVRDYFDALEPFERDVKYCEE